MAASSSTACRGGKLSSWKLILCLLVCLLVQFSTSSATSSATVALKTTTTIVSRALNEDGVTASESSQSDGTILLDGSNSTSTTTGSTTNDLIEDSDGEEHEEDEDGGEGLLLHEEEHESEPGHAVLFPSFSLTLGLLVFYLTTRYWAALPYTAIMFLIGTMMGIAVELLPDSHDHVSVTTRMWSSIDSEVLLLVFLPGLIFKDAMGLNVHLFQKAIGQCLIFAFPMVLLGTFLSACVARYIFPYDWSWNLALCFGSILSATDPVAVAALLEEVGAPPRLKVHIGGEALLNDGAAIVFFTIFATRYFYELGIPGVGEEIDLAEGFAVFFRMSLGGALIGLAFGLGILFILWILDRRFSREENIVEVTATAAMAYLGYYVAEVVCKTSGVIATVVAGVTVKFLGRAMLNDAKLLEDFWVLIEHLLNTVLFTLGGAVWGTIISNGESHGSFVAQDWGYLFLLYILLTLIRALLFTLAYPITSRIGLKTSPRETVFQIYGGLRGAVGIALAIALDVAVESAAGEDSKFADDTNKAFGMIGGMAFLTLVINGTTAGPLLVKMGLADSTETRAKIVKAYSAGFRQHTVETFVRLLTEHRFRNVNFGLVKSHVPYLADMTKTHLVEAVEYHKDVTASDDYMPPYLHGVLPYLADEPEEAAVDQRASTTGRPQKLRTNSCLLKDLEADGQKAERNKRIKNRYKRKRRKSNIQHLMNGEPLSAAEMRVLFISLLRANYELMIDHGELVDREFLAVALEQSLEFAADSVANGGILEDWRFVQAIDGPLSGVVNRVKNFPMAIRMLEMFMGKGAHANVKYSVKSLKIERAMCFMAAHERAQHYVEREFATAASELSEAVKIVMDESKDQWTQAEAVLHTYKKQDVEVVISHKFCSILLNSGQHYITKLVKAGLLKDDEAEHWVKDIEEHLEHVHSCCAEDHPGELSIDMLEEPDCRECDEDIAETEDING